MLILESVMFFQHQASQEISALMQKSSLLASPGGEIQLLSYVDTTLAGFFSLLNLIPGIQ